jgi:diaminohydroxyphosphoribosylaminopyrimidine deaminase/5-amino-6-(5-phosphoribosylamino)uracil reductase
MKNIPALTETTISRLEKSLQRLAQAKLLGTGLPLVTLKFAQTLDGKIATLTGDSRWISGSTSLRLAHRMRSCHDALLVGVGTVIRDDPLLTVRLVKGKNPQKIVLDSRLRTPPHSNVLRGRGALSTIIATTSSDQRKIERIQSAGARVWLIKKDRQDRVRLPDLLRQLGQENIRSVLVEGGSRVHASFLEKKLADHLLVVIAPRILGKGISCVRPSIPRRFRSLISLSTCSFFQAVDDVIMEARLSK